MRRRVQRRVAQTAMGGVVPPLRPRARKLPWRGFAIGVAIIAAVAAAAVAVVGHLSTRNCEWECSLVPPLLEIVLGLMALVVICLVVLAAMLAVWLWRKAKVVSEVDRLRDDDDSVTR